MPNKINPRKQPRPQADVDKALHKGHVEGMLRGIALVVYILKEKFGAPDDDLLTLYKTTTSHVEELSDGVLKWEEIEKALKDDYDIRFVME